MASIGYPLQYMAYTLAAAVGKYRFVTPNGNHGAQQAVGHAAPIIGTTERPGLEDEEASICIIGDPAIEAGGVLAVGNLVTAGADGRAVLLTPPRIRSAVVNGGNANANIPVPGILAGDSIASVVEFETGTNNPTDRTAGADIAADGQIRINVATNNDRLHVLWREAPRYAAGIVRQAGVEGQIVLIHLQQQIVTV